MPSCGRDLIEQARHGRFLSDEGGKPMRPIARVDPPIRTSPVRTGDDFDMGLGTEERKRVIGDHDVLARMDLQYRRPTLSLREDRVLPDVPVLGRGHTE